MSAFGTIISLNTIVRFPVPFSLLQHFRIFYPEERQRERHPEHELEVALREGQYAEEGWRVRKDGTRFFALVVIIGSAIQSKLDKRKHEKKAADLRRSVGW